MNSPTDWRTSRPVSVEGLRRSALWTLGWPVVVAVCWAGLLVESYERRLPRVCIRCDTPTRRHHCPRCGGWTVRRSP